MATQNYQFSIPSQATCSAGVYNASGVLIRTLFSLVSYNAGIYTQQWDGNDDFGNAATGSPYTIKILSSNTTYTWEGVIGNTSDATTGSTVLRTAGGASTPQMGVAVSGSTMYWALGYSEQWPGTWKMSTSDFGSKTWIGYIGKISLDTTFVCTDGTTVYWGAFDSYSSAHTGVYGTLVSGDTFVTFSSGTSYTDTFSTVWSLLGYSSTAGAYITGMAVQQTHNYLIVCRSSQNQVLVINKSTGAIAQTITTITAPGACCIDGSDNVWIADSTSVKQYSINSSTGALTATGTTIALTNVGALCVDSTNTYIIAADMTNQQVKQYSVSSGSLNWTLGTGVSYASVATVANNKFYWVDVIQQWTTFLTYLPDGTFLVGDLLNSRIQRFNADQSFNSSISWQPDIYIVNVDPNTPTRVFSDFLEYTINYSNPLATSWTLVNNWRGNYGSTYDATFHIQGIVTLSNGRTYARMRSGGTKTVVELVAGGAIRYTGINPTTSYSPIDFYIDTDGSRVDIAYTNSLTGTVTLKRYVLSSFNGSNNPVWAGSPSTTTTVSISATTAVMNGVFPRSAKTANGNLIVFDNTKSGGIVTGGGIGYHLGGIQEGGTSYTWQNALSTLIATYLGPFPGDSVLPLGWFDSGNGVTYPGTGACVNGNHVIWGYHGEGWKNSQTNIWTHVDDSTGLIVGQFGAKQQDFPNLYPIGYNAGNVEAPAGLAGNALAAELVSVNGNLYLWHGDESFHGGMHRWHIQNTNTINIQTAILTTNPITPAIADLHAGLTAGTLATGNGWTVGSFNSANGNILAKAGTKSYDTTKNLDVNIAGGISNASTHPNSFSVQRALPNYYPVSSWSISGFFLMDTNTGNTSDGFGGISLQVLDANGLVIAQIYYVNNSNGTSSLIGNSTTIFNDTSSNGGHYNNTLFTLMIEHYQQYTISALNGVITIKWGNPGSAWANTITTGVFAAGAIWSMPTTLQVLAVNNYAGSQDPYTRGRSLGLYQTTFQGGVPINNI